MWWHHLVLSHLNAKSGKLILTNILYFLVFIHKLILSIPNINQFMYTYVFNLKDAYIAYYNSTLLKIFLK